MFPFCLGGLLHNEEDFLSVFFIKVQCSKKETLNERTSTVTSLFVKLWFLHANHPSNSEVEIQKWNFQSLACDDGVKNEFWRVLAKFKANLSFPGPGMLLLTGSKCNTKVN